MQKLLHPSINVLRVDGTDEEALEMAMVILHDIGWLTQQCGFECALNRLRELHDHSQELFIQGCAHGAAALHGALGRKAEAP